MYSPSHRALMLAINAKVDYVIAVEHALANAMLNPQENQNLREHILKSREKMEKELKTIAIKDKTKGGFNDDQE